jgi:hypothetical protein
MKVRPFWGWSVQARHQVDLVKFANINNLSHQRRDLLVVNFLFVGVHNPP